MVVSDATPWESIGAYKTAEQCEEAQALARASESEQIEWMISNRAICGDR
jgi:hypothetical protein